MSDIAGEQAQQGGAFLHDVLSGLGQAQKTLPSRWLYDRRGSELFERITDLPEYYPTRTETSILREHAHDIAGFIDEGALLIEYGAGAGIKTEILLDVLREPAGYMPVDIAGDFLRSSSMRLAERYPRLAVLPTVADFTSEFEIPPGAPAGRRAAFFPGSTIGNLDPPQTRAFLSRMHRHVRIGGKAVIGVDLKKDIDVLLPAYDDGQGVTAEFNLNLLARINRELGGDFDLRRFAHEARWNAVDSAVEMHLVSLAAQQVTIRQRRFRFDKDETIHTESSRKYDLAEFGATASSAGWDLRHVWSDPAQRFAVLGLEASP